MFEIFFKSKLKIRIFHRCVKSWQREKRRERESLFDDRDREREEREKERGREKERERDRERGEEKERVCLMNNKCKFELDYTS